MHAAPWLPFSALSYLFACFGIEFPLSSDYSISRRKDHRVISLYLRGGKMSSKTPVRHNALARLIVAPLPQVQNPIISVIFGSAASILTAGGIISIIEPSYQ